MANDFFAATNTAGFLGKALIGRPAQNSGYPKGVANASPFALAALTKLWTLAAAGDATTETMEIYDGSGYFFGEPLDSGEAGPGQFTFSPTSTTGIGNCRMFSATISGFVATSLDPATAAWTRLTSTYSNGQSATKLAVIDNGLVRVVLNKNSAGVMDIYGFNGTAWKLILTDKTAGIEPRITNVVRNTAAIIVLEMATASGQTLRVTMYQSLPIVRIDVIATSTTRTWAPGPGTGNHTILAEAATPTASDLYTQTGSFGGASSMFAIMPLAAAGLDVMYVLAKAKTDPWKYVAASYAGLSASLEAGQTIFVAFAPRTYGIGNGGGADVGNGASGQLRECEDNVTYAGGASGSTQSNANSSGGKYLLLGPTMAVGWKATWSMDFPAAGLYYVFISISRDVGSPTVRVNVTGVANVAAQSVTIGNTDDPGSNKVFGTFDVPAAGNRTVELEVITTDTATLLAMDHISIFPYASTSSTPITAIMPKNIAHSTYRPVIPPT